MSRKRETYAPKPDANRVDSSIAYAELHAHSAYSFLDGASTPEELVEEAARLDLRALALTDHNGLYGAVRFAEAASGLGVRTVFGAELSLGPEAAPSSRIRPDRIYWCWPEVRKAIDGCHGNWPRRIWPAVRRASHATTSTR
ncbi:PHP domain protein [Mycobacterium ulcerans str. Harvey]|uniref:PHP domain protein n=1 Tax=Mycobacterium ulcerans str. Harvey TaxID=1299332 RepID=A0ABN0R4Y2_MYCUL|nr:PHP domain protein [Mycobacterium ulcerans str. Harvey]